MRRLFIALLVTNLWLAFWPTPVAARVLPLDSCRALALRGNKSLAAARQLVSAADNEHRAAQTLGLPRVAATGTYVWSDKSVHLLSRDQRASLSNLGTAAMDKLGPVVEALGQTAPGVAGVISQSAPTLAQGLNGVGSSVAQAFQTSTYNLWAGALVVTQPLYLGGRIRALTHITDYTRQLLGASYDQVTQDLLYSVDETYWQVVALANKERLAQSYVEMLERMSADVERMFREGLVNKAATLTVRVKENEARMALSKVRDGLSLSRMLLCQLCGLETDETITLADEAAESLPMNAGAVAPAGGLEARRDLDMLRWGVRIADENVALVRAAYLPTVGLFGGYNVTNPNVYDGFRNRFAGNINIGVAVHMPLLNWGETRYKVRAAKSLANAQRAILGEMEEKVQLQMRQARYKRAEAAQYLQDAQQNFDKAKENLHYAEVGFSENVMSATDLLQAQTAWLQARTELIDAQIGLKLTEVYLRKVEGTLL